jgi:hypothetical protein
MAKSARHVSEDEDARQGNFVEGHKAAHTGWPSACQSRHCAQREFEGLNLPPAVRHGQRDEILMQGRVACDPAEHPRRC